MILQLDPGNPDAEADAIARLADEYQDDVAASMRRMSQTVVSGLDAQTVRDIERLLPAEPGDLREALEHLLSASAGRGARAAIEKMKQVYIGVDWALVNEEARDWARRYSYDLVSLLDDNSRVMLQEAVSRWVESGAPMDALVDDVARIFGTERAKLIAVTEATRAYAEGSFTSYEQAGFNRRPPEADRPPAHPGCRCWVSLAQPEPGLWEYVWLTAVDERVCPVCSVRHMTSIGFAGRR
jgi:hypothetical protein